MRARVQRIALRKIPDDGVFIGSPSKWANLFSARDFNLDEYHAYKAARKEFKSWINWEYPNLLPERRKWILDHIHELYDKDLYCWCKKGLPCHGDVLLQMAEGKERTRDDE